MVKVDGGTVQESDGAYAVDLGATGTFTIEVIVTAEKDTESTTYTITLIKG